MKPCPLCQNASSTSFIKKHYNHDILYCSDCQLQFSYPMHEVGGEFYKQSNLYECRSENNLAQLCSQDWRFKTCLAFCNLKPKQRLLDIGCGDGGFMALAHNKGLDVFGIDIDDRAIFLAREYRYFRHAKNISRTHLKGTAGWNNFDIITSFDTLEHVSSPLSMLSVIFTLLKPGGLICISVPRLDRYPKVFDIEADWPPHHFTLWTAKSLKILLKTAGFEDIAIIDRPLLIEDIVLHLHFRINRFIRKVKAKGAKTVHTSPASGHRLAGRKNNSVPTLIKRTIYFILFFPLKNIDKFFIRCHLGKGYTLLAIAQKPCE